MGNACLPEAKAQRLVVNAMLNILVRSFFALHKDSCHHMLACVTTLHY